MNKGWSFESGDWDKIPNFLLEKRWKQAKFIENEEMLVANSPGVYMFVTSVPKASNNIIGKLRVPIYIGLSKNLRRRFKEHLGIRGSGHTDLINAQSCFGNKLDFFFLQIDDRSSLRNIEQILFNCFGPIVNKINSIKQGKAIQFSFGKEEKI